VNNAEADIPAQEAQANAHPRLSGANGDARWATGTQGPAQQGTAAPDRNPRLGEEKELERELAATSASRLERVRAVERRTRLRRSADLGRVREAGRSWPHRLLVLVALANQLDSTRVGVTASRRVGSAVSRNRAKRLLREAARRCYPRLLPGWDLLLVARRQILSAQEPEVREALVSLLARAELLVREETE
jgi:ribonuclease P protein component